MFVQIKVFCRTVRRIQFIRISCECSTVVVGSLCDGFAVHTRNSCLVGFLDRSLSVCVCVCVSVAELQVVAFDALFGCIVSRRGLGHSQR